jgi:hypothetical protein
MNQELREIFATARRAKQRAEQAAQELERHLPTLENAVNCESGQGEKTRQILMSLWNGDLCDRLSGLDHELGDAVLAAMAARLFMSGDADALLRPVIDEIIEQEQEKSASM